MIDINQPIHPKMLFLQINLISVNNLRKPKPLSTHTKMKCKQSKLNKDKDFFDVVSLMWGLWKTNIMLTVNIMKDRLINIGSVTLRSQMYLEFWDAFLCSTSGKSWHSFPWILGIHTHTYMHPNIIHICTCTHTVQVYWIPKDCFNTGIQIAVKFFIKNENFRQSHIWSQKVHGL